MDLLYLFKTDGSVKEFDEHNDSAIYPQSNEGDWCLFKEEGGEWCWAKWEDGVSGYWSYPHLNDVPDEYRFKALCMGCV